jgi:hypothetical protein
LGSIFIATGRHEVDDVGGGHAAQPQYVSTEGEFVARIRVNVKVMKDVDFPCTRSMIKGETVGVGVAASPFPEVTGDEVEVNTCCAYCPLNTNDDFVEKLVDSSVRGSR